MRSFLWTRLLGRSLVGRRFYVGCFVGYWLVGTDGGIFSFDAPFKGSMGSSRLNKPVIGMVAYGDGYLMVAQDGGIFSFSNKPFVGSLGSNPPPLPIVAVAPYPK